MNNYLAFLIRETGQGFGASLSVQSESSSRLLAKLLVSAQAVSRLMREISLKGVVITAMLLSILVLSAVGVVYSSHLSRQLFAEQAVLWEKNDQLQLEWAQLLLEQSAWSSPNRVESIAAGELKMQMPEIDQVEMVR